LRQRISLFPPVLFIVWSNLSPGRAFLQGPDSASVSRQNEPIVGRCRSFRLGSIWPFRHALNEGPVFALTGRLESTLTGHRKIPSADVRVGSRRHSGEQHLGAERSPLRHPGLAHVFNDPLASLQENWIVRLGAVAIAPEGEPGIEGKPAWTSARASSSRPSSTGAAAILKRPVG
jgi:hypothetical protein